MTAEEYYADYSKIRAYRKESYFGKIPVLYSYFETENILKSDTVLKLKKHIQSGSKVLDIGAAGRSFKEMLDNLKIVCDYKSMDIDKNNPHDFYSIADINEEFDHVILFNILEHMPFEMGMEYLSKAYGVLNQGGYLYISVPNIWHPNHMYRSDITHVKPYPFQDLSALLGYMGFDNIEIFRIHLRPYKYSFKKFLQEKIKIGLHQLMDLDYTKDIWAIARKK